MASKELLVRGLDADGHEISGLGTPTAPGSATFTDNATEPAPVGTASPGSSFVAAAQDHTHEGVHGISVNGGAVATGDIDIVGAGVSRTGNTITVANTSKITLAHEGAAYSLGIGEEIIREFVVNFDDLPAGNIKAKLAAAVRASGGLATYALRVGAAALGSVTGSVVRATFTSSSATDELKENEGAAFTNPTGNKIVQITANNDTALKKSIVRGITISLG